MAACSPVYYPLKKDTLIYRGSAVDDAFAGNWFAREEATGNMYAVARAKEQRLTQGHLHKFKVKKDCQLVNIMHPTTDECYSATNISYSLVKAAFSSLELVDPVAANSEHLPVSPFAAAHGQPIELLEALKSVDPSAVGWEIERGFYRSENKAPFHAEIMIVDPTVYLELVKSIPVDTASDSESASNWSYIGTH